MELNVTTVKLIIYMQTTLFSRLQWKGGNSFSLTRDLIFGL